MPGASNNDTVDAPIGVEEVLRDLRVLHSGYADLPRAVINGNSAHIVLLKIEDDGYYCHFAKFYRKTDNMTDIDRALKLLFPTITEWGMTSSRISGTDRGVFSMLARYPQT